MWNTSHLSALPRPPPAFTQSRLHPLWASAASTAPAPAAVAGSPQTARCLAASAAGRVHTRPSRTPPRVRAPVSGARGGGQERHKVGAAVRGVLHPSVQECQPGSQAAAVPSLARSLTVSLASPPLCCRCAYCEGWTGGHRCIRLSTPCSTHLHSSKRRPSAWRPAMPAPKPRRCSRQRWADAPQHPPSFF